jgi:DNA helicase-2/ATP-dependent DNA helicase PcrA
MGTFHSIFARILRIEAKSLNYEKNFSIYDAEDSSSLVSNIISNLNIELESVTTNTVKHRISFLKNHMIMPPEFKQHHMKNPVIDEKIYEIYVEYQARLKENNAMDFEDLLLKPSELFKENPKIHQKYKKRFAYILVDEFQDTNKAQYELLKMLAPKDGNIAVVGDDAQSIYSWRGATIENMLHFEKDYPKHKIFKLEQNYRSTKHILLAADSVIKNNRSQIMKTLWTDNNDGELLTLIKCSDEKDEAFQIAKSIKHEISKRKLSLNDIGILYRTNAQSRALEDIFRREKIPYIIIGGVEFYKRKEVKDVLAYLRILSNQNDEESLLRIMNFPQRGIGNTTIKRMISFARKHEISMFDTMSRVFEVIDIKERIQKNVKGFRILLEKYIALKDQLSVSELSRALLDDLGILRMFKEDNTPESLERLENINGLLSEISEYCAHHKTVSLEQFLEEVSLIADVDMYDENKNAVTLLTIHSAKGLEFPVVFISGCEEDIFPLSNKFSSDASLEEERRLFYVAVTRAKQKVYISHARSRYRFGEVAYQSRSRFIDEIEPTLIAEINGGIGRKSTVRKSKKEIYYEYFENVDYSNFDQDNKTLRPGSRVMHDKFGLGKVTLVAGAGDMQKATVVFEGNNVKQLMLKFAKLKVL